jgi:hypothetical protein
MNRIRYLFSFYPAQPDNRIISRVLKDVQKHLSAKKFEKVTRAEIR